MDCNRSNIIWVRFERGYLFRGIVVIDAKLEIIRAANDPILAGNEAPSSYGNIGEFKGFDN